MTRIGVANAASTMFISGIGNSPIAGGLPVVVNAATRQIRYAASSERYKTEINSLGTVTAKLVRLRLVSFRVKSDRIGAIQYELMAVELDTVYPEYVIRDAEGRIPGVRYDEQATNAAQDAEIRDLKQLISKVADLEQQVARLHAQIQESQSKDPIVARR